MQDIGKANSKFIKSLIMNIRNTPIIILYFIKQLLSNIMQLEMEEKLI